jgi:hypothetical protein
MMKSDELLPEGIVEMVAAIADVRGVNRVRFAALLSRACRAAWRDHPVKRKPLRASGVRRQLQRLLEDRDAALDDHEGDAAHAFVSAVRAANPRMGFVEVVNRAIYHVVEHPHTRLPNRGRSTGTTGNPAFDTFCVMLLSTVSIVGGKLVCWRIGGRTPRCARSGHAGSTPERSQARPVRGTAKGSFVLALTKLKPHLPSGFVPVSDRAIASAYERALKIRRVSDAIPVFFGSSPSV